MPHVYEGIDVLHDGDVGLIVSEVFVCLDRSDDVGGLVALLQLDIDHTAVDTCARGNRHREGTLDPCDRLDGHRMSHTHPWAEVGIRDPPWYDSLHEGTYDRVTPGVPPRSNHRDGAMLTGGLPERTT